MKIACIMPESKSPYRHKYYEDYMHQSGLIILQAFLQNKGYDVILLDYLRLEGEDKLDLDKNLYDFSPDILCVCGMFCIEDIEDFVKEKAPNLKNTVIVSIGTGALDFSANLERMPELAFVIPVNPEEVMLDIISYIENRISVPQHLLGAAYKNDRGEICFSKRCFNSIDDIFTGIDVRRYVSSKDKSMAYIWSSRGCWYSNCTFCNVGAASNCMSGIGWQARSIDLVIKDMKSLYDLGVNKFHFLDAEFIGLPKNRIQRVKDFVEKITASGIDIQFYIDIRADNVDYEILSNLKHIGLASIFVGFESASNNILKRLNKGYKIEDICHVLDIVKKVDMPIRVGTLLADPYSTLDDIKETIDFYIENKYFDYLRIVGVGSIFHELHLHMGTPIYKFYKDDVCPNKTFGEVPCYYLNADTKLFIEVARYYHNLILERYNKCFEYDWPSAFKKRYFYSLRIIALYGLQRIIIQMQQGDNYLGLKDNIDKIIGKHDNTWLTTKTEVIENGK